MKDLDCEASIERYHALLARTLQEMFGVEDAALIDEIEHRLGFREIEAGGTLFAEEEAADDIFFVLAGRLRAERRGEDGGREILGEIVRGELAGELSLATGARARSATVVAARDAVVARLARADFEAVLLSRPPVALAMMRTLLERQRRDAARMQAGADRSRRAVNLFVVPADGAGSEPIDFALQLAAAMSGTRVLRRGDLACGSTDCADAFGDWLQERECGAERLMLVAAPGDHGWNAQCAVHADEMLLVADGRADAALSPTERHLRAHGIAAVPQTLVLRHAADLRTPTGTARWFADRTVDRHFHVRHGRPDDLARLARELSGRARALVLSGGGARGFAHVGAMQALAREGRTFDRFGGTSIGAVFSALAAAGLDPDAIERVGRAIFLGRGGPTNDYNLLPMVSLIKGRKVETVTRAAIRAELGAEIAIEDMWHPWFAVTANYATGAETVLSRGPLARSILASLAIPGALPPMVLGGELFVDGGTVNNLPVDVMRRMGADAVTAVDLSPDSALEVDYDWVPTGLQLLRDRFRRRDARRYSVPSLSEVLLNAAMLHSKDHQAAMRALADRCIRPDVADVRLLDWKRYDDVVERGRRAVDEDQPERRAA